MSETSTETLPVVVEREIPLNWNKWLRQIHRWLSIAFAVKGEKRPEEGQVT